MTFQASIHPSAAAWRGLGRWGQYGQYQILNWATKFFADSLLMRMRADAGHAGAGRPQ
jgi:hypothetical protein